jgi:hypothetical protein
MAEETGNAGLSFSRIIVLLNRFSQNHEFAKLGFPDHDFSKSGFNARPFGFAKWPKRPA